MLALGPVHAAAATAAAAARAAAYASHARNSPDQAIGSFSARVEFKLISYELKQARAGCELRVPVCERYTRGTTVHSKTENI